MAKGPVKAFARIAVSVIAALFAFTATAEAKVLFEKTFGEKARRSGNVIEGAYTEGYRPGVSRSPEKDLIRLRGDDPIVLPLVPGEQISPAAGAIVVRVKHVEPRVTPPGYTDDFNTIINVMDNTGKYLFNAYLLWGESAPEGWTGATNGGLNLSSDIAPGSLWGTWIPFDRVVAVGEWVTLSLVWDNSVTRVYQDGRELKNKYEEFTGSVPTPTGGNFSALMNRANTIRIGADAEVSNSPLRSGVIEMVQIHDQAYVPTAPKPVISAVSDDTFQLPGISGKLVAGQVVTATLLSEPGGKATFDLGTVRGIPMSEIAAAEGAPGVPAVAAGTYRGSYTIKPGDDFADGYVKGNFLSAGGGDADPVASTSKWTIDTKPVVAFTIDKKELSADSATKAVVKVVAKDANGAALEGRHLKLTLATTDEYTGLVGAGDFGKDASPSVETRWKGATDRWGEVEFEYTSGFAAKTVILQAKDLDSGGVAVDFIRAFKEASIDIALTQPISMAAARRGSLYVIKVEASRTQLTADGRSRSVIRATVLDPAGNPVPGEPVLFTLSSENGSLKTITGETSDKGVATAEYTAGKKVGIVVITATDTVRNISGNVSILLLADAPAKILIKARPESMPADGNSRANLEVKVTDINDNPNKDTKVEFRLSKGSGKLESAEKLTDIHGDAVNRFTAGTTPGIATILATVRSKVPTDVELAKAKNVLFAPYNVQEEAVRVSRWLRKNGDKVLQGEGIVEYTVGRGNDVKVLVAPFDLTVDEILVEEWDKAEVGQSLLTVVPVVK